MKKSRDHFERQRNQHTSNHNSDFRTGSKRDSNHGFEELSKTGSKTESKAQPKTTDSGNPEFEFDAEFRSIVLREHKKFRELRDNAPEQWTREFGIQASTIGTLQLLIARHFSMKGEGASAQRAQRRASHCYRLAKREREARRIDAQLTNAEFQLQSSWYAQQPKILQNKALREPQKQAWEAARKHFQSKSCEAIIQLPVGCGKSGLMALLCFLPLSSKRLQANKRTPKILVVTPNVEIRKQMKKQFAYESTENFYQRFQVLDSQGPSAAELSSSANIQDCDEADVVIANIQQLLSPGMQDWLGQMAPDYFDWIFIDEGHHNPAESWRRCLDHFETAKTISLTATPFRSDKQNVSGEVIYKYELKEAIQKGFIKSLYCWSLDPSEVTFVYNDEEQQSQLTEVLELRDQDWFSRGVALAPQCNQHIVDASIQALRELQKVDQFPHKIIAAACSIDHGKQICALYRERRVKAVLLHSHLSKRSQEKIREDIRKHKVEVVVQIQMLGEGADYPSFSIAAIFRPFRHFTTYYQFIGRILRRIQVPNRSLQNRGIIVSHRGLNLDRWWTRLLNFDELETEQNEETDINGQRLLPNLEQNKGQQLDLSERRYIGSMEVVSETVKTMRQFEFIPQENLTTIEQLESTLKFQGLKLEDLGLSKAQLADRLNERSAEAKIEHTIEPRRVNRQRKRQQQRQRLNERVRSAGRVVVDSLKLPARGYELYQQIEYPRRTNNLAMAIILLNREVKALLGVASKQRSNLPLEELQKAYRAIDDIVDRVKKNLASQISKRRRTRDSLDTYPLFRGASKKL